MSSSLNLLKKWYADHRDEVRNDLFQFLRFQSISADPTYKNETLQCAHWVRDYFTNKIGMQSELIETEGYPIVYAEDLRAGPNAPTILLYGHYDVQPVDPLELWNHNPFDPTEKEGVIYARGAADDKGQIFYAMLAVRSWKELGRELPVNLKFCIEGEEESASIGLSKALPHLKKKLQADTLVVVDFNSLDQETPALTLGARGLFGLEVALTGSSIDLHSGQFGGLAYNPIRSLVELLSKLWDEKGRVQVNGFYDDCIEMREEELARFAFHYDEKEQGILARGGERDRSLKEANGFRPTVEINGISGGYAGAGLKTVIPSRAIAKITCRLVPNQDPKKIGQQVTEFLKKHVAPGMKIEVHPYGGEPAFRGNPDSSFAKAIRIASYEVTGKECVNVVSGGSIPVVAKLMETIGAEVVGIGYGLPDDNVHAPNENFSMDRVEKGFLTVARAIEML